MHAWSISWLIFEHWRFYLIKLRNSFLNRQMNARSVLSIGPIFTPIREGIMKVEKIKRGKDKTSMGVCVWKREQVEGTISYSNRQVVIGIVLVNGLLLSWPKLELTLWSSALIWHGWIERLAPRIIIMDRAVKNYSFHPT